jgi:transglutaminase-like putative cysteine protease
VRPKLLLLLCALALPLFAREFEVRPAPAWVERVDAQTGIAVARQNVRWGIYDILSDHQVRAGNGGEWQYFRTVRKVLSPSGVQNASELSLDFDPSYETLVVHDITIIRGAQRTNALHPDDIRVIEKEDDADDRIYDGEHTALIFLKDVRPGDVIDYSWSIDGANPLLGGKYNDDYDLSTSVPAHLVRHRLLWLAGRPLQWRGGDPAITTIGPEQAMTWELRDLPPLDVEDAIPSWYEPWRSVQVTEFASWHEVAAWASAMFTVDARSAAAVKQLADKIRAEHASRDARITAAIRFVQDDVRYLGIEMGRNSHEPHQPWETLDARYGDCKDKTLLLAALLRELGLAAYPALVNTRLRHRLQEKLPSPFLFDHVIAEVVDGGKTYWVDGTMSDQGGALATLETPSDGYALVVRDDTHALTRIVTSTGGATVVDQTYTTRDFKQPVSLVVRTTYTGGDADAMRSDLATESIEDFARERINTLAADQPKIEADGLPRIADDRAGNRIVIVEKYRVRELWEGGHWTWYPRVLDAHLNRPETMIRSMPLAFDYPLDVRQSVTFNFPEAVEVEKSTSVTETPTFRYDYTVDRNGNTVTIRQSLHARRDFVAAKDVADHLTKLNAIWSEIAYRIAPNGAEPKAAAAEESPSGLKWGIGFFIAGAFIIFCWLLATRSPAAALFVPAHATFRPGEAPASAVAVGASHEIDAHLARLACACGSAAYSSSDIQRARYAEREMTIVTRHCGACGREQSVYFTAA